MQANILKALASLQKVKSFSLPELYSGSNRVNNMGVALEYFVKDAFCGSYALKSLIDKDRAHSKLLSYIGNANNPPDFIVRGGDAVEVKKIQSSKSGLALNSSYPKNRLYSDNPLITEACRQCEEWDEKDIIYTVGVVADGLIKLLWFVYGDCYAADKKVYESARNKIISGIQGISSIEFSETRELGRVNRVDPLGITYLRVRGMWGIENPTRVFNYLNFNQESVPSILALMRKQKFDSFPESDRASLEKLSNVQLSEVEIKDPDNPAKFIKAKAIKISP